VALRRLAISGKNIFSQDSVYENSLKSQRFERLEKKIDQLSKQVEQIRGFVITIARRLNGKDSLKNKITF